jgi:MoaA/NifB/PqqE/SkfB family radical SAM enzyme
MLNLGELILELTRRCNMSCAHCLRGAAQRVDMDVATIHNTLKGVERIGSLVLTGGEPSLKPEAIVSLYNIITSRRISVEYFYVVTNAKSTYRRQEFLEALDRLYGWCDDKGACSLVVSQDQFHNELRTPNMKGFDTIVDPYGYGYSEREYFRPELRTSRIETVILEGRAEDIASYYVTRPSEKQAVWEVSKYEDALCVNEGNVYVSANGNVTSCCDMSYKRIDSEAWGNVNNESLVSIILNNCVLEEEMSGEETPLQKEVEV